MRARTRPVALYAEGSQPASQPHGRWQTPHQDGHTRSPRGDNHRARTGGRVWQRGSYCCKAAVTVALQRRGAFWSDLCQRHRCGAGVRSNPVFPVLKTTTARCFSSSALATLALHPLNHMQPKGAWPILPILWLDLHPSVFQKDPSNLTHTVISMAVAAQY